ncbi:hypothetical protein B1B04_10435 [Lysinibacillus sp. KCTC 33748]|uniref:hypothetical protein n=1 Tax=unclassified Lysinibacillus TaxID=2636778 RepID=UPI0009A881BD|nr:MULTISPECIES: hypothetical protein [unclassified Lysinibacillus]OXS74022.1 hypothetical protein B1B04_10435 [Lysinibacillus sp. KCTC 33748]SKB69313.1 hypothetical protein SAMN06295926_10644 [Lysinibacillus sp. AC-3]
MKNTDRLSQDLEDSKEDEEINTLYAHRAEQSSGKWITLEPGQTIFDLHKMNKEKSKATFTSFTFFINIILKFCENDSVTNKFKFRSFSSKIIPFSSKTLATFAIFIQSLNVFASINVFINTSIDL